MYSGGVAARRVDLPRRPTTALLVLATILLAQQVVAPPLGDAARRAFAEGTDAGSQWRGYLSSPAPDVLIIGDSRAGSHVDAAAVAGELLAQRGPTRVGRIGLGGAPAGLLDALVWRILEGSHRPRAVVYFISELQLNALTNTDPMEGFWQLNDPSDLRYVTFALGRTLDPVRFLEGVVLPLFAEQHTLQLATNCIVKRVGSPRCTEFVSAGPDQVMDERSRDEFFAIYRRLYASYAISDRQLSYLTDLVDRLRSAGTSVVLVIPPSHRIAHEIPQAYSLFRGTVEAFARAHSVPLTDLTSMFDDDMSLWREPSHLNAAGALRLAPTLAEIADRALTSAPQ